jgi:hypothetical protein
MGEIKGSASNATQHLYGHNISQQKVAYRQRKNKDIHMICVCECEQELHED